MWPLELPLFPSYLCVAGLVKSYYFPNQFSPLHLLQFIPNFPYFQDQSNNTGVGKEDFFIFAFKI